MADTREAILARLRLLIESVEGLASNGFGRNRDDVSGKARPAIILHDGTEETHDMPDPPRRSAVQMIKLVPEFVILVGAATEQVGSLASLLRSRLLFLVLNDSELIDLVGGIMGVGDMRYEGCELVTAAGTAREGRMTVHLSFTYPSRVSDLAGL